jgi:hypothetical protein
MQACKDMPHARVLGESSLSCSFFLSCLLAAFMLLMCPCMCPCAGLPTHPSPKPSPTSLPSHTRTFSSIRSISFSTSCMNSSLSADTPLVDARAARAVMTCGGRSGLGLGSGRARLRGVCGGVCGKRHLGSLRASPLLLLRASVCSAIGEMGVGRHPVHGTAKMYLSFHTNTSSSMRGTLGLLPR